jgi:sugar/nucleoside kinase (ribokinase family)
LVAIFRRVKEEGTTTSLDMALPDSQSEAGRTDWRRIFERLLPYVDLFHPSAEEALFMAEPERWASLRKRYPCEDLTTVVTDEDFTRLSDTFLGMGAKIVTLKAGPRGFYLRTGEANRLSKLGTGAPRDLSTWANRELWMPAYQVNDIVSATGAGDCSLAGFITAFLKEEPPERCLAAANALAFQNLQALDAVSGVKDWDTTLSIMADRTLPRREIEQGNGWRLDHATAVASRDRLKQLTNARFD